MMIGRTVPPSPDTSCIEIYGALDLLTPFADVTEVMRLFIVRIEKGLNLYQHPVIEETFANHGKDVVPEPSACS